MPRIGLNVKGVKQGLHASGATIKGIILRQETGIRLPMARRKPTLQKKLPPVVVPSLRFLPAFLHHLLRLLRLQLFMLLPSLADGFVEFGCLLRLLIIRLLLLPSQRHGLRRTRIQVLCRHGLQQRHHEKENDQLQSLA